MESVHRDSTACLRIGAEGVSCVVTNGIVPGIALLCNPYHRGGIERFTVDLALAWTRAGGSCWLVLPRPRTPFRSAGPSQTVASLVDAIDGPSPRPLLIEPPVGPAFEFGTEAYRAAVYTRAILDNVPPSIPIVTSDDPAAWRAASWLSMRNPALLVVHGDYTGYYDLLGRYASHAAAILPISRRVEAHILGLSLGAQARVEHIPTGIVLGPTLQSLTRTDIAELVWVGRMDESSKRVSDLPRIVSLLRRRGLAFRLTLVGDGDARPALESAVAAANLVSAVQFRGWMASTDVRALLGGSDVLLLPSNREGLPVSMMEALAAGCAVVASRVSGVEDYAAHELASGCLWVHEIGDVAAAADLVARAVAVPRGVRVRAARALAEAEFSIDRCVERYVELISSLSPARPNAVPLSGTRERLIRFASIPVAAQRRLRLWAADSMYRAS